MASPSGRGGSEEESEEGIELELGEFDLGSVEELEGTVLGQILLELYPQEMADNSLGQIFSSHSRFSSFSSHSRFSSFSSHSRHSAFTSFSAHSQHSQFSSFSSFNSFSSFSSFSSWSGRG